MVGRRLLDPGRNLYAGDADEDRETAASTGCHGIADTAVTKMILRR